MPPVNQNILNGKIQTKMREIKTKKIEKIKSGTFKQKKKLSTQNIQNRQNPGNPNNKSAKPNIKFKSAKLKQKSRKSKQKICFFIVWISRIQFFLFGFHLDPKNRILTIPLL
jgi:hypothetical protein